MTDAQFIELSARQEAVARLVLHVAVELESTGHLRGQRLQESLLSTLPGGTPMLDRSAELIRELMSTYSAARSHRQAMALRSENRSDRND